MVIGNILHLCTFTQLNNKKYKYLLLYIYSIVMNKAEKMKVTNTDLLNNRYKYSIDILEHNIVENHLDEKILLATQTLTPEFCVKYILDLDIEGGGEESYIFDVCYILQFQKHITKKELKDLINISDDFVTK
jgi:hypothetical protein